MIHEWMQSAYCRFNRNSKYNVLQTWRLVIKYDDSSFIASFCLNFRISDYKGDIENAPVWPWHCRGERSCSGCNPSYDKPKSFNASQIPPAGMRRGEFQTMRQGGRYVVHRVHPHRVIRRCPTLGPQGYPKGKSPTKYSW